MIFFCFFVFFFKQKTAYDMRISDWSSDVCSSDLADIGFAVAPRLNAAGRLEDMALGIECLLCDDPAQARELAAVLDRINAERRAVQQQMVGEAETALATVPDVVATPRVAHCLFSSEARRGGKEGVSTCRSRW